MPVTFNITNADAVVSNAKGAVGSVLATGLKGLGFGSGLSDLVNNSAADTLKQQVEALGGGVDINSTPNPPDPDRSATLIMIGVAILAGIAIGKWVL